MSTRVLATTQDRLDWLTTSWWVALEFVPQDAWIGVFWRRKYQYTDVYVCLLPCFPMHLTIADRHYYDRPARGRR